MTGKDLHPAQGKILLGSARTGEGFCTPTALQIPQKCIVKSMVSCTVSKGLLSTQSLLISIVIACL